MSDVVLSVETREAGGKGAARAVRREGKIPGVIYGGDKGPVSIAFQRNEIIKAFNTGHFMSHLVEIDTAGERQQVIPKDVQFDPVSDEPLHIDLYRVDENTRIDVEVTVHFINQEDSPGLKRGGVLNVVRHTVELNCPAGAIPEELIADVGTLTIGDAVHISSITLPEGVRPTITDRDFTIATIAGRMAEVEEEDEAAADEVPTVGEEDGEEAEGEESEGSEE